MFRDAWLVTKKDLLIELRSRILINQIAPYTLLILVLFGFALDADTETLRDTGPVSFGCPPFFGSDTGDPTICRC